MNRHKIFTSSQIKVLDSETIAKEPITSVDLMERAASNLLAWIENKYDICRHSFVIICGTGNNGGDGLALARLLLDLKVNVKVLFCRFSDNISNDCQINLQKIIDRYPSVITQITDSGNIGFENGDILVDCIFGSGLARPVTGEFARMIDLINDSGNYIISIDIPSGLFGEDNSNNDGSIIKADCTFTLEFPPISSMFAENYRYYGNVCVVPIGLDKGSIEETPSKYSVTTREYAGSLLKKRKRFDHKGIYGHALIVAGSYGKAGAAVLSSSSCIKTGAGLVTTHVPSKLVTVLQSSIPEVMLSVDENDEYFTSAISLESYSAVALGPGLGTNPDTSQALVDLVSSIDIPLVIDADAINILSKVKDFHEYLHAGTILTPHPKEFERLFGKFDNSWQKMLFMSDFSQKTGIIIVLKGGITTISLPDGSIVFNTLGNPGMATGGSGDVLTGIIVSLLAQKYDPSDAAVLGVYIHSYAGDSAKNEKGENSLIATDIINNLFKAFVNID